MAIPGSTTTTDYATTKYKRSSLFPDPSRRWLSTAWLLMCSPHLRNLSPPNLDDCYPKSKHSSIIRSYSSNFTNEITSKSVYPSASVHRGNKAPSNETVQKLPKIFRPSPSGSGRSNKARHLGKERNDNSEHSIKFKQFR